MADDLPEAPWLKKKQQPDLEAAPWQAKTSGKVPSPTMSAGEAFGFGMQDPLYGGAQLGQHAAGADTKAIDEEIYRREAEFRAKGGSKFARGVGSAVMGLPLVPLGGVGAVAGGAIQGALQPTTVKPTKAGDISTPFAAQKVVQAAIGGALGTVGAGAVRGIGAGIAPEMRADAQALLKSGVELTPGQSMGGFARWAEEAAKKIPILNQFIRSGERNSIGSFNNAVLNQALEPIGRTLPEVIQPGHDAFRYAERQFNNAYGTLLPNMRFNAADPDFLRQAADIAYRAQTLGRDGFEQYQEIARQRMARFIQQTPMPGRQGQTLKDVESELRQEAEGYQRSSAAGERNLGNYLGELHRALMDSVKRQNPNSADLLDRIDSGYAMFATARDAANRGAIKEGVFMPSDLLNIIKQKAGKNQFARGDALLQTYAETAQRVLPGKMPDSGTPERLHAFDIASAAGGAPFIPFYLRPVTGASLPTANEQAIREYLRTASPYVGTGIEPILQRMLTRQQNASQ